KLIVHSQAKDFTAVVKKAERALQEFRILGLETNLSWLRALLTQPKVQENNITTRFIEQQANELAQAAAEIAPALFFETANLDLRQAATHQARRTSELPAGTQGVTASMHATVVTIDVCEGDTVVSGQQVAVLEAMKMEHVVTAPCSGIVKQVLADCGETLMQGDIILAIAPGIAADNQITNKQAVDLDIIRKDLREVEERRALGLDQNRPDAVAKRHTRGQQTARENLAQVCDEGTFIEYGEFAIAAQRQRRSLEDLLCNTTGDGMITGLGRINGDLFDEGLARCAFAIGDYMVLAGTQGTRHHRRLDRILSQAAQWNIPLVFFAEGGGGRPGDTDRATNAGISNGTFSKFAELSGQVPLVGVVSGRCFAGNAAFLGCCDVIIADESSNVGMAGPAMIEGGGLGVYPPEAVGPIDIQSQNGVVDIRVKNEAEACVIAKKYLSYFQGPIKNWQAPDQRQLRHVVPENRLRVYAVNDAIKTLADEDSVLELRREFGVGIVTAFIRIEGKPFGVMANNPKHLGGAIDADAADKASRFMQLCDAFDIPMISLCDCPGFMVGPEAEKTALVRHVCRMYVTARSISIPLFGVVLRKCYGLGAMAMLGGGTYDNFFTVAWPSGEFGPMGLEGAVKLGYRRELDALKDPEEKQALYEKLLEDMYQQGKAIAVANTLEVDAVIDPIETRHWILSGLASVKLRPPLSGKKRPFVDTW
ncbi:MAG: carbamoyl-phosphate synthase large subunit, partial [Spongiibacteraceae bacterium]|nr:carbamoyl-phosphate synthase large subunit [Spongiibacteraceae bacterium]